MARDLWRTLLRAAGKAGPLSVSRALLDECEPEQVARAFALGILGEPELADTVVDPRYGPDPLPVEFRDGQAFLILPPDSEEIEVPVPREKLERYPVSLPALLGEMGRASGLVGTPRKLHCGLWLVGRRKPRAGGSYVCLAPALRGPVHLIIEEAWQELGRPSMIVLLPEQSLPEAPAADYLAARQIRTMAIEDRLRPDLRLDLEEVPAFTVAEQGEEPILHIDVRRGVASFGGVLLSLRRAALRLLDYLASRPQEFVSHDEAGEALDVDSLGTEKWMRDRVRELREALRHAIKKGNLAGPEPREIIENKRGHGYALMLPPEQISRAS